MSYLLNPSEPPSMRWTDFFDVIIVGANKPAFLLDERYPWAIYQLICTLLSRLYPSGSLSLYHVTGSDGSLRNILSPMDHLEALRSIPNKIFQGGNAQVLHGLLDISSGEKILYVGDHIYSDIVRSKRSLGWRTCFIVPELTRELENLQRHQSTREEVMQMRKLQYLVDNEMDRTYVEILRLQQRANESEASEQQSAQSLATLNSKYHAMQKQVEELKELVKKKQSEYDGKFHPLWGRLFKAGFQDSRISKQIRDFACLFTSKASNIAYFSPSRSFRPIPDVRAHDLVLALGQEEVVPWWRKMQHPTLDVKLIMNIPFLLIFGLVFSFGADSNSRVLRCHG